MPGHWQGANRNLPPGWAKLRRLILERDGHRCQWLDNGQPCGAPATDVDHAGHRDDYHPSSLRSLCADHHKQRTSRQGNEARWATRTARPTEPHPGLR